MIEFLATTLLFVGVVGLVGAFCEPTIKARLIYLGAACGCFLAAGGLVA